MASPPDFLTVEEARAVLGVGRTFAYRETGIFVKTQGKHGAIPAIQLKPKMIRVSRIALEEMLGGPLTWPPPLLDIPVLRPPAEPSRPTATDDASVEERTETNEEIVERQAARKRRTAAAKQAKTACATGDDEQSRLPFTS
jgi:hypothetical protein